MYAESGFFSCCESLCLGLSGVGYWVECCSPKEAICWRMRLGLKEKYEARMASMTFLELKKNYKITQGQLD